MGTLHSYETYLKESGFTSILFHDHAKKLAAYVAEKERHMSNREAMGTCTIVWDEDEDSWYEESSSEDSQIICGDDSAPFMEEEWRGDGEGEVRMEVFRKVYHVECTTPGTREVTFMVFQNNERIMINKGDENDWVSFSVYTFLDEFLKVECGCQPGLVYVCVFTPTPVIIAKPTTVTKRRRLTFDVEIDVELDEDGRPLSSPGAILYEEGMRIIERFKNNPHFGTVRTQYWNVDHIEIGSPACQQDATKVDEKGAHCDDYLRFNDRPGVWPSDRVNTKNVKVY